MRFTMTKICGRSGNHTVLAAMGLLAGVAACSGQDKAATPASGGETGVQFALTSSCLPTCGPSQDGEVYYVWSDSKFYVCHGSAKTWVQTNLNGVNAVARVTPISPGSQCPTGGNSIQFGLDQNSNGKLDNSEVTSTTVVCNGATGAQGPKGATGATGPQGPAGTNGTNGTSGSNGTNGAPGVNSLVRQDNEPPGANCPAGGVRIESGLDLNHDGILEANEVTATSYTCNAVSTLVNILAEPAGPNCSAGGQAIQTGADTNSDGILEPGEVQHTSYVCSACEADPDCVAGDYCANGVCKPRLLNGASCSSGTECMSLNCAAGFCCNTACGECNSCSTGTCTPLGDLTLCGAGPVCTGGILTGQGTCSGGTCVTPSSTLCPTGCKNPTACNDSCLAGTACQPTNPCRTGTISCTTGSPVCVENGNQPSSPAISCGPGPVCTGGILTGQGTCSGGTCVTPSSTLCPTGCKNPTACN